MPQKQGQSCGVSVSFDHATRADPSGHRGRDRAAALLKKIVPYDAWVTQQKPTDQEKALYWQIVDALERLPAGEKTILDSEDQGHDA